MADTVSDETSTFGTELPTANHEGEIHSTDVIGWHDPLPNDTTLLSSKSDGNAPDGQDEGHYSVDLHLDQADNIGQPGLFFKPDLYGEGVWPSPLDLSVANNGKPALNSLVVSAGTLTPDFSGTVEEYTVPNVPYSSQVFTISTVAEAGIAVNFWQPFENTYLELEDLDDVADGHQISLVVGENAVEVSLTKGNLYRDYRLLITRAKPTVSIRALSTGPATEGDTLRFEIKRSAATTETLAVRVAADELDAIPGEVHDDILPNSIEDKSPLYYIEADDSTAILEIETTNDDKWENHSKIEMEIVADASYSIASDAGVATTVVHDDEFLASGAVLTAAPNPVGEGDGNTVVTVTVTTEGNILPHGQVTIPVTTSAGTASGGNDYTELDSTLTFSESDFSQVEVDGNSHYSAIKTVDISITPDKLDEGDELFTVSMGAPSDSLVTLDSDSTDLSVTIVDDDLTVTQPILTAVTIGNESLTPSFSSNHLFYEVPNVTYVTHLLTITPTPETGATASLLDSSDNTLDDLDDAMDGHQVYLAIGETTVKVRVAKESLSQEYSFVITRARPEVSIRSVTTGPATEGDTLKFELRRSLAAGDVLTVDVAISEVGVDAESDPGDLFPDSEEGVSLSYEIAIDESTATIEVETTGDNTWEKHSNIEVKILEGDSYTINPESGTASVMVKDNEFVEAEAVLHVSPNPISEDMGNAMATITVTTKGEKGPHGSITIPLTTSDDTAASGEDYMEIDTTLTFSESQFSEIDLDSNTRYRAFKTVDISIVQDNVDEDRESFSVALGTPSDSLVTLDTVSANISVAITDDDDPPVLTSLSLSVGTLTPSFSSNQFSYDVPDIGYGTHLITIAATPASGVDVSFLDSSNNVYEDLDAMTAGHQVYLEIGNTMITIRVSEQGAEQDYTLVIGRAKPMVSIRTLTMEPSSEGDTLSFEVVRSAAAGDILEVRVGMDELDVIDGDGHGDLLSDVIEGTSPLREIEAGQRIAIFTVETVPDTAWEKHSKVEMRIKPEDWYTIDAAGAIATIVVRDDDFPEAEAVLSVSPNPVNEGTSKTTATITVTTAYATMPHGQVSILLTTSDGSAKADEDYVALKENLVLAEEDFSAIQLDGNTLYQATKAVDIMIVQDDVAEDAESFDVMMGLPSQSVVGIDADTSIVSVLIDDDDNSKPTVTITTVPSPANVLGRGVVDLDGESSDSNNDTLTYIWSTTPEIIGKFGDANLEDTTWTAPAPLAEVQTITLTLTVTDNGEPQEQGTATAIVTVEANQGPLAEASASSGTVQGGGMIALTGGGSDPEQGVLTYKWSGDGAFNNAAAKDTLWTAPQATNQDQTVILTLTVTDELGLDDTDIVQIIVSAMNDAPSFSTTEAGERNILEGSGAGYDVGEPIAAVDEDGERLIYVLGGPDASSFEIDGAGQIVVGSSTILDYEIKGTYAVTVSVSDGKDVHGNTDSSVDDVKEVTISVVDVEEDGSVSLSPSSPQVGEEMIASVTDPDNYTPIDNLGLILASVVESWTWERSDNSDGPWATIADSSTATYTPVVADKGKYLRATAVYSDRRGLAKTAGEVSGVVTPGIPSAPISPMTTYRRDVKGLMVSWSPPLSDGGDPITEYLVQWRPTLGPGCPENGGWENGSGLGNYEGSDECDTVINHHTVTSTTYTITTLDSTSLVAGTPYDVRVSAANVMGIGGWSEVVRARTPSADATLDSLTIGPVDISEFRAGTMFYALTVSGAVAQATVSATTADSNATAVFSPPVDSNLLREGHQIALNPGETVIAVTVTAENGETTRTYTIIITRVMGNSAPMISVSPDLATVNGYNGVSLNGTSSDLEKDRLSYSWTASVDIGQFEDESREDTMWIAPAPRGVVQTVVLTLTVRDGKGGRATDRVVVTVNAR